jgi:DNA-binding SARP family transcriptional activator/tetratricopeptide (TPR) repeat protein
VRGVPELRVRLLGGLTVEGVPVLSLGSRKARAVLRRLALAEGGHVLAEDLAAAAWPEGLPARWPDQLAVLVSRLRGVVGAERLVRHPAGYGLLADWLDTTALREHVRAGEAALAAQDVTAALQRGRAAVALLRGPLLPEDGTEAVEEERTALARVAGRARLLTAEAAVASGSPWEALELAVRCREDDPYDEAALRVQLQALAATSRTATALTTYLEAAEQLRDELGTEPQARTQQVYLDLLREEPVQPLAPAAPASLAGRDADLRLLQDAWATAVSGEPRLVLVEGPPGIGKSSLLEAFAVQVGPEALVVRAAPDVLGADLPLQPVLDALGRAVGALGRDDVLEPDADLLAPLLGRARPARSTASAFATMTTGAGRAVLLTALETLLHRLGGDRPVLLLLDDGHGVDATTAQLLHRCTRSGAGHRLLVVVAARKGHGPGWQGTRLELGPLDRSAAALVVGQERVDELWQRSGGHPLFLVELARYQGSSPPSSVLTAVASRCAGTDEVADTLRTAAVLGTADDLELLSAVLGVPRRTVLARLEDGARQALLVEDAHGFSFAHELFREAFSAGIGPTRTAELHADAARALAARRTAEPTRIAHHATLGGDPLLAAEALTTAAELADQRYEHEQARALLDRAVALEDSVTRRLVRARVLLQLGRYDEAERDAQEAFAQGAGAAALELTALAAYFQRDLDRALELADEAARSATDPELAAGCWCLAGRVLLTLGRLDEGTERLAEAADLATGRMRGVTAVWQANALSLRDHGQEAYRLARGATALAARRDPLVEPYRAMALGRALAQLDRPFEALRAFEEMAAVVERQQITRFAGRSENFRGWVLRNLGAHEQAEDLTLAAWELVGPVRELAHAEAHCHAVLDLADAALRRGDLDAAQEWLQRRERAPLSPHVMKWRIDLRHGLLAARLALAAGDHDTATERGLQVLAEAGRLGVSRFGAQAQALLARAELARGDRVDLDALERTAKAVTAGAPLESWWLLAELARDTGEPLFRRLAEKRVTLLVAGAGPWAEGLRTTADVVFQGLPD